MADGDDFNGKVIAEFCANAEGTHAPFRGL